MARVELGVASDAILVQRAADGDAAAFETLVRRHAPYLRAYAIRLAGSRADADDALQETVITAWRKLDSLTDGAKFRSWATSILARQVTDQYRRRHLTSELDEQSESLADLVSRGPEASAEAASQLEALAAVLAALPTGQRQCWLLREVSGFSYDEIGAQLDMDSSTVRGKLARARATVAREMEGWR